MLVVPARLHRWPPEVQDLFGREGPLVLEIGFGDGRFTAELARSRPDWLVLGAEVSAASVLRALRRMRREGLANVRLYHGQGPFALRNLVLPGTLDQVIVNFPDPWPKKRHQERRLLREAFFRRLSTRLKPGGASSSPRTTRSTSASPWRRRSGPGSTGWRSGRPPRPTSAPSTP